MEDDEADASDKTQVFDECHGIAHYYVDHGQQTLQRIRTGCQTFIHCGYVGV